MTMIAQFHDMQSNKAFCTQICQLTSLCQGASMRNARIDLKHSFFTSYVRITREKNRTERQRDKKK